MANMQILGDGHRRGVLSAHPNVRIDARGKAVAAVQLRVRTATPFEPFMADHTVMPVVTPLMCLSEPDRCP